MMQKQQIGAITAGQMALIMYTTVVPSAILLVPHFTAQDAGRDLWLSPLMASVTGLALLLTAVWLHHLYPGLTIIQYSEQIMGRILGKIATIIFIFHFLHVNAMILRGYGEFVAGMFLPETPLLVTMGGLAFLCAQAVRGGGFVMIARLAQLILPVILLIWSVLIMLSIPNWEIDNMFPILADGIRPPLKGAVKSSIWFNDLILLAFLIPFVANQRKVVRWGLYTWAALIVTMVVTSLIALFIFGQNVSSLTYPFMEVVRYIRIANFIEHLDALLLLLWATGVFIQVAVFHNVVVLSVSQCLKLSDDRILSYPLAVFLVAFAFWVAPNLQELNEFTSTTEVVYNASVRWGIPFVLLFTVLIKYFVKR